ncbi:NADPH-dependent FMN reductase [Mycolicibacterium moriokaense]|uniref:NADPH-dependent FMN reductase n=1 Tax=Mycolicibacterium moriokaense TaxID=39691 RepID=UPI001F1A77EF|nr:NAD(P)H-dependent oxidoreductase [Mycolicibacterium moriokaense]
MYNDDFDQTGSVAAEDRLRAETQSADALLLVTPEYNGTMAAALKNAIDWISRPFGAGVISGKPVAVIGTSHGQYGGCGRTMTRVNQHPSRGQMCSMISSCRCLSTPPLRQLPSRRRRGDRRHDAGNPDLSRHHGPQSGWPRQRRMSATPLIG